MIKSNLLDRFLRYVKINTQSDPDKAGVSPSAEREFNLAYLLRDELAALGMSEVVCTDTAYVYAALPASAGCEAKPKLGFIAHMDTSPDFTGEGVTPVNT